MDKKNLVIFSLIGVIIILGAILVISIKNDSDGKSLPDVPLTGKVSYSSSLTYSDFRNGINLDAGWNTLYWPMDGPVTSTTEAFSSISSNYYYAYDYNYASYDFNPNQIYAGYGQYGYPTFNSVSPGRLYGIYMPVAGTLRVSGTGGYSKVGDFVFLNGTKIPISNLTVLIPNLTSGGVTFVMPGNNTIMISNGTITNVTGNNSSMGNSTYHSADRNKDWRIDSNELNYATGLYNYTYYNATLGTITRTGEYYVSSGEYYPGPGEHNGLTHSADTNSNWKISLVEYSRIMGLSNATGYRVQSGTEDGFAPIY